MSGTDRIIILVDMDCFYCQVEEKLNPSLKGKPVAVVQYNAWKGGGLIAVNYEAKDRGVTRHMRGDDAKRKCPDIELVKVPTVREKADLTRYREAGKEVAKVLQNFTSLLERASVDEAYLDITEPVNNRLGTFSSITPDLLNNTHIVGFDCVADFLKEISSDEYLNDSNVKLAIGGIIAEEIRAAVYDATGYRCSAGIAHNKVLAKLTAGLHKPNKQTILPHDSISKFYENLSVKKIRSMGGKFGEFVVQKLNVTMMGELINFSKKELQNYFEDKTANWLYNIARGVDLEPVTVRLVAKSIGCCKRFPGRGALVTEESVKHWIHELSIEIAERIEKDIAENNRKPKQIIINYSQKCGRKNISNSRSQSLNSVDKEKIYKAAYEIVKKNCLRKDGSFCITFLGLNVSKFEENKRVSDITSFFKNSTKQTKAAAANEGNEEKEENRQENLNVELKKLTTEIDSVVATNIKLNCSFQGEENDQTGLDSYFHKHCAVNYNSDLLEQTANRKDKTSDNYDSDDSTAELEAINASVLSDDPLGAASTQMKTKNSFFHNFLLANNNKVEPPRRDFNMSIVFEEMKHFDDDDNKQICSNALENVEVLSQNNENRTTDIVPSNQHSLLTNFPHFQSNNSLAGPSTSKSFITDDNKELCTECNKFIPVEDIVSHMDYHFAIKIVREEAHLYKPVKSIDTSTAINKNKDEHKRERKTVDKNQNTKTNNNNTRKRKSSQNTNKMQVQGPTVTITSFFNKENEMVNVNDENSSLCPDCSKRIKFDDYASHLDYHIAKKLHLEINAATAATTNNLQQNNVFSSLGKANTIKMNRRSNNDKGIKNINNKKPSAESSVATYFKKV